MASVDVSKYQGTRLVVVTQMPQTQKKWFPRSRPKFVELSLRTKPMLDAEIALSEFAIAHRGDFGTVQMPNGNVISKLAFDAGNALRGKSYGGLTYEQRLKYNQKGAESSLARLKKARESATVLVA